MNVRIKINSKETNVKNEFEKKNEERIQENIESKYFVGYVEKSTIQGQTKMAVGINCRREMGNS